MDRKEQCCRPLVAAMLLDDGSRGNLDLEAAVMEEEEEGSSNTGCGYGVTTWVVGGDGGCLQAAMVEAVAAKAEGSLLAVTKSLLDTGDHCWLQEIFIGHERSLLVALWKVEARAITIMGIAWEGGVADIAARVAGTLL
ncbi:hypothetical protein BHM03_00045429 [Ensete ventricosum]|nr:hypothetical protein BHM03_00045429 [Ensete ventricosum]